MLRCPGRTTHMGSTISGRIPTIGEVASRCCDAGSICQRSRQDARHRGHSRDGKEADKAGRRSGQAMSSRSAQDRALV